MTRKQSDLSHNKSYISSSCLDVLLSDCRAACRSGDRTSKWHKPKTNEVMQHDSASTRDRNEISERRHELYVDTIDKVLIILGGGRSKNIA